TGSNTQTAVIKLCDDIRLGIDELKVTVAVFFDFSKAFDSVNHKRLLRKLLYMNFDDKALEWVRSYLGQRGQSVQSNGRFSQWREVLNGVPQSSVLGPLLFSLYISDLAKSLKCQYIFYADDLVIYLSCHPSEINDHVALLNNEIAKIINWCKLICLKLNASKTKAVIFGSRHRVGSDACVSAEKIVVDDCIIPYVESVEYLGVIIDNVLAWEDQVTKICNQAMRTLAQLKISNEVFNEQLRIKLVTTLIFPIFDYCSAALTNISNTLQLKLQRKMNSCVRFIYKISKLEHVTPFYKKLGWLKLSARRDYFIACLFF
ncbi:GSCOCG00012200001-RA-CDS, partial [Cotesia congregata]